MSYRRLLSTKHLDLNSLIKGLRNLVFALGLLGTPLKALAQTTLGGSCLPNYTALQLNEMIDPQKAISLTRALSQQINDSTITTKVQWQIKSAPVGKASTSLQMIVRFDPDFDGVSLPYNLYGVMVILNGEVVGWFDYTSGCQGSGISFFPGREIRLPDVKLPNAKLQHLQVMVWGRL